MEVSVVLLLLIALNGSDGYRVGIVGGREAAPNSRPYMASLQIRGQHICGGVLVREDYVLTAAHCRSARPLRVVLGAHSLSAVEAAKQEFGVINAISHPRYNRQTHQNDVMLLKLNRKANLTREVQVIPLMRGRLRINSQCSAAGWGDLGNDTSPDKLQEVNEYILSMEECRRRWNRFGISITNTMICTTGPNQARQGPCRGDSGGPLVCDGTSTGVVSFGGRQCANYRTPAIYMRTSSYRRWIRQVLNRNQGN
ncbi:mast cell protease 1A-like [Polymixia lowei]